MVLITWLVSIWLSLIKMHHLTASALQELRIDLEDFQGKKHYACYSAFTVDNVTTQYRLTVSEYSGTIDDDMRYSSGAKFSMKDRENDTSHKLQCSICHSNIGLGAMVALPLYPSQFEWQILYHSCRW